MNSSLKTASALFVCFLTVFSASGEENGGSAQRLGTWYTSSWSGGFTAAERERNLIALKTPESASGLHAGAWWTRSYEALTDRCALVKKVDKEAVCLVDNASVTYTLALASVVEEVRIYCTSEDQWRDKLKIESVVVETLNGENFTISPSSVEFKDAVNWCPMAILKMDDGSPLCSNAHKITINFGPQERGFVNYSEIEVLGYDLVGTSASSYWETSSWRDWTFAPAENNLLLGISPVSCVGFRNSSDVTWASKDVNVFTDGVAEQYGVENNLLKAGLVWSDAVFIYEFDEPSNINEIRIYSTASDEYRDELAMESIIVETSGGFSYAITPPEGVRYCDPWKNGSGGCPYASLKMTDGTHLCKNVVKITFNFGEQKRSFVHYSELEVIGSASNIDSLLKLSLVGGNAKRFLGGDAVFSFVASCEGVADPLYEWDLDGDGVFETLDKDDSVNVTLDSLGATNVRVRESTTGLIEGVEVGVYPTDVYIASDNQGGDKYPYSTPEDAANNPDSVTSLLLPGSTIHLLPGVYKHSFSIGPGIRLVADNPAYGATVVTNDLSKRVFEVYGDGAMISGLTIAGGGMPTPSGWQGDIPYTQADEFPGGACVYVHDGGVVSNCWMSQPNAGVLLRGGAGGCIYSDNGQVIDCVIANALLNSSKDYQDIFFGLGIYQKGDAALIDRCIVSNIVIKAPHSQDKHRMGAAIQMTGGTVRNTLVTGCRFDGATYETSYDDKNRTPGILASGGRIENCTIAGNTSYRTAAGIVTHGSVIVANTVVAGNDVITDYAYPDVFNSSGGTFLSCCTQTPIGNYNAASGNISADPLFVDSANGNFMLQKNSPCRNTADSSFYTGNSNDRDLARKLRFQGEGLDIGCYEYPVKNFMVIVR